MAAVTLIEAPYHLGRRATGMGLGPEVLVRAGLADAIGRHGPSVEYRSITITPASAAHEIGGVMAVSAEVAREVAAARQKGALPIVLAGDCAISVGVLSGIRERVGIVWFDAHGDFNTPETTVSGYFNGMALSMAVGQSWRGILAGLEGFRAVDDVNVVLAGGRAFDPAEEELFATSALTVVPIGQFQNEGAFESALEKLATRVREVYVHVDLDVLDPSELEANALAVAPGATVERMAHALAGVRTRFTVAAVTFSSYDPGVDRLGRGPAIVKRLSAALL